MCLSVSVCVYMCVCVYVCVCFSDEHSSVESQQHAGKRKSSAAVGRKQTKKRKLDTAPNPLDATWIHPESYELTDK